MRSAFLLALVLVATGASAAMQTAVWVWEPETMRLLDDAVWRREIVTLLKEKQVTTLYLYADSYKGRLPIRDEPEIYRALLFALHREGFRVYALLGSYYLQTERYVMPDKRGAAMAMLGRVFDYNAATKRPEERFDGVNIDIEPYLMPEWKKQRVQVLRYYLDLGSAMMKAKRDRGSKILIGPAMPFWFDGDPLEWQGTKRPMNEHVQSMFDYVALMDYRDKAEGRDSIISHAVDEMAFATKIGKPLIIGVDCGPGEMQKLSFREESESYMRGELAKVAAHFGQTAAFGGFAIHHLGTFLEWCCQKR